jgi:hypothetical protein
MVTRRGSKDFFSVQVNQLSLTREDSDGNHINRSSNRVFARRRRLGIFALAQGLAPSKCQEEHSRKVTQSAVLSERRVIHGNRIFQRSGSLALAGFVGFSQTDSGPCTKPTCTQPCATMVPDEIVKAKVLYARARAWLLGETQRRGEPKWRKPGDVEAAFFALYDALRSQTSSPLFANAKNPPPISNHI